MAWERCARLLLLCSPVELDVLLATIQAIVDNIRLHPNETKYKELKQSNKNFRSKVLDLHGGPELLLCMGFTIELHDDVKVYCYRFNGSNQLNSGLVWLSDTITTCKEYASVLGKPPSSPCAEVTLQIRLPNNQIIQGGFSSQETVRDVKSFVCTFYQQDRHASLVLKLPHSTASLAPDITLLDLDLVPRGILVVRMQDDESYVLHESKVKADVEQAKKVEAAAEYKAKLLKAREQEKIDRENTLRAFKEDRSKKKR